MNTSDGIGSSAGPAPKATIWSHGAKTPGKCGLLLACAGFEERSIQLLRRMKEAKQDLGSLLLIHYKSDLEENNQRFSEAAAIARQAKSAFLDVELDITRVDLFQKELRATLAKVALPPDGELWLDISGLTMFGICIVLRICRIAFPLRLIRVLYTEAKTYYPLRKEYETIRNQLRNNYADLPESLTSEMDEILIPETFSGFSLRDAPTCLLLMAGYERHRSGGIIDQINPSRLVLLYGSPTRSDLSWRLEMAKDLHRSLLAERETAEATCDATDIDSVARTIREFYEMLYDDHNFSIAPTSGKLHTIATYLVWESLPDIQLVFSVPVSYLPGRYSVGVGETFSAVLPPPPSVEALLGSVQAKR